MSTNKQLEIKREYLSLHRDYQDLKDDYSILYEKYQKLLKETSENTVLQSMNDMKLQYQDLLRNTVPKEKYEELLKDYSKIYSSLQGLNLLITNLGKHINSSSTLLYTRFRILKEIIQDTIISNNGHLSEIQTLE